MHAAVALGAASLEPFPVIARASVGSRRGRGPVVLGPRALNRALLARQMLLERARVPVAAAIRRLVGLQAQNPMSPYLALWSRLEGFRPEALGDLMERRQLVRTVLMRSTIHMVTADDCRELRPVMQPVLERAFTGGGAYGRRLHGVDVRAMLAGARAWLTVEPRSPGELGRLLAERWPHADVEAMVHAARGLLPLVQVTPRGVWGKHGQPRWTTVDAWLGPRSVGARRSSPSRTSRLSAVRHTVRRYLAAFGPATTADLQTWSGLTHLQEVLAQMRSELRIFRDEVDQELFDLPRAPRPDPDVPAPIRFLPDYDNVLLSHANRSRIIASPHRPHLTTPNGLLGTILIDGFVSATWRLRPSTLEISPLRPLPLATRTEITEIAHSLPFTSRPERVTFASPHPG